MTDGVVKSLQKLGFTFKNPAIFEIVFNNPSVTPIDYRFFQLMCRINLKRLNREGRPYLDYFRKLVTENYHKNRVPDMNIFLNVYFKSILDQIDVKIGKDKMKPFRAVFLEHFLRDKDNLTFQFIDLFLDEVSKNSRTLRQTKLMNVCYVLAKAHNEWRTYQVTFENHQMMKKVYKSFAAFIKTMKDIQTKNT